MCSACVSRLDCHMMVMIAVYQATDFGYKAVSTMGLAAVYTSVKARTCVVATKSKLWRSSISYTEPPQCRHTCHSQVLGSQNCTVRKLQLHIVLKPCQTVCCRHLSRVHMEACVLKTLLLQITRLPLIFSCQ